MKPYRTLLYYCYTHIENPEYFADKHHKFAEGLGLVGRVLVAKEGVNGTISGSVMACQRYMDAMRMDALFKGIEFKVDEVDVISFDKLFVRPKEELVHLAADQQVDPLQSTCPHLSSQEVLDMMEEDDVVMLDVRNTVEHEVGKFKDARTLDIDTFREFPDKLNELEDLKEKRVIAYCTGGIRCEKATMLLKNNGFENVFQIDGGIFKYARETGGKDFDGKMYVFDKRVAVEVNTVNPTVISKCRNCNEQNDRLVNCANPECNEHFVLCEKCGTEMEGCCSQSCKDSPNKRPYDGTGYYSKGPDRIGNY